mgnify:FL=1
MPKISLLVAVYNTAAYLPQCLDSLLSQTLKDIEVICVDDASTDNSLALLHQYAEKDNRVRVFALKENSGQAHTRNVGLSHATGDYIGFVDSDDWLSQDALEKVCESFRDDVDSVLFRLLYAYTDGSMKDYQMSPFTTMTGDEAFRASLTWQIHGCYVVRNAIHKAHPYDESQRAYSDDNTTRIHYYYSRKVAFCEGIYYYRQQPVSVTRSVSVRRFDYLVANESMRRQLLTLGASDENLCCYETIRWLNLVGVYMFYYLHRNELSEADRQHGLSVMHHVWQTINLKQVSPSVKRKFGYIPLRFSWSLFCLQEEVYFWLRGIVGRNK